MYPTLLSASVFVPPHLLDYTNKGNKAWMTRAKLSVFTGDGVGGVLEIAQYEGHLELKQSNSDDAVSAHPVLLLPPEFLLPEGILKIRFGYFNHVHEYVLVYEGPATVHILEGSGQGNEWLQDDVIEYIDLTKDPLATLTKDSSSGDPEEDLNLSFEIQENLALKLDVLPSVDLLEDSDIDAYESEVVFGQGGESPPDDVNFVGTEKKRHQLEIPEKAVCKADSKYTLEGSRKGFSRFSTRETKLEDSDIDAYESEVVFGQGGESPPDDVNFVGTEKKRHQLEIPEKAVCKADSKYTLEGSRKGFSRFSTRETKLLHSDIDAFESEVLFGQGGESPPDDVNFVGTEKKRHQLEIPEKAVCKADSKYTLEGSRKGFSRFSTRETKNYDVQNGEVQRFGLSFKSKYAGLIYSCMDKKRKNCIVCARKFARSLELARHQIGHAVEMSRECGRGNTEGEIQYPCGICDEMFGTIDQLKFHLRNHANLPQYQCELCSKTFSDCSNYSKHKKTHLGARVRHCDQCKRTFQTKATLIRHMEKHINTKPIVCEVCFQIFPFKADWTRHTRLSHGDKKVKYRCKICHAKFGRMQEKWDHEWDQHNMRKSVNDCDRCPFQSRKSNELRLHYRLQHGVLNYRR